jgi:hypothetical protein
MNWNTRPITSGATLQSAFSQKGMNKRRRVELAFREQVEVNNYTPIEHQSPAKGNEFEISDTF